MNPLHWCPTCRERHRRCKEQQRRAVRFYLMPGLIWTGTVDDPLSPLWETDFTSDVFNPDPHLFWYRVQLEHFIAARLEDERFSREMSEAFGVPVHVIANYQIKDYTAAEHTTDYFTHQLMYEQQALVRNLTHAIMESKWITKST